MLFSSIHFLLFVAMVTGLYFAIPFRFRWAFLLFASYAFYASAKLAAPVFLILLTLITYSVCLLMGKTEDKAKKRRFLFLIVLVHVGFLFVFKYYDFFSSQLESFTNAFALPVRFPELHLLLPVGISFYTFKSLAYAVDVYRGRELPEKHLGYFAVFIAFFPQLMAGPIERASRLLPQFREVAGFNEQKGTEGLRMILWGLFQKMVIADNLAPFVNLVYNDPGRSSDIGVCVATFLFAFQIYYDFDGYSNIAIGSARVLGFETMKNFDRPYSSTSIGEFWRRWHISLSTWLRDYVYIPLGGNRVSIPKWYVNLMVVFLLCGLWHGANWGFVVWGGLHGFYLVFGHLTGPVRGRIIERIGLDQAPRLLAKLRQVSTFCLVCFAWIFFRANNLSDAFAIVRRLFMGIGDIPRLHAMKALSIPAPASLEAVIGAAALMFLAVFSSLFDRKRIYWEASHRASFWRWTAYYVMVFGILLLGRFGSNPFIYFQF
jgi:alginate O-acetyltransferase complex protein AlgI